LELLFAGIYVMEGQCGRITVIAACLTSTTMLLDESEFALSAPGLLFLIILVTGVCRSVLAGATTVFRLPAFQDFAAHFALH
jgi:hypothetical protein